VVVVVLRLLLLLLLLLEYCSEQYHGWVGEREEGGREEVGGVVGFPCTTSNPVLFVTCTLVTFFLFIYKQCGREREVGGQQSCIPCTITTTTSTTTDLLLVLVVPLLLVLLLLDIQSNVYTLNRPERIVVSSVVWCFT